ncbi:MAG: hypothetical protein AAF298_07410 [Cyanobacteria bacterium P01_A01_bin.40]
MIIKVSARGEATRLARHLTNTTDNEAVEFSASRYLSVWREQPVHRSLMVIDALAAGTGKNKNLLHVSLNPDRSLRDEQWQQCWREFEREYNLEEQAYIEVTHNKQDRLHKHRVYNRIRENGTEISIWHNYLRNEKLARKFEYSFGHPLTYGKHNRAVISQLTKEGLTDIVQWMEQQQAADIERPVAGKTWKEEQQSKRTKVDLAQVQTDLKQAYEQTANGQAFQIAIAELGYRLARGERTGKNGRVRTSYVIVDHTGNVHGLRRRLGIKAKELNSKLADVPLSDLPTVEAVKDSLDGKGRVEQAAFKQLSTDEKISQLQQQRSQLDTEIRQIEQALADHNQADLTDGIDEALLQQAQQQIPHFDLDALTQLEDIIQALEQQKKAKSKKSKGEKQSNSDQTDDITPEQIHYRRESDSERGKPLGRAIRFNARGDNFNAANSNQQSESVRAKVSRVREKILTLEGNAARRESDRRLHLAEVASNKPTKPDPNCKRPIRAYLTELGQHLKQQGRGAYHTADKWLAEKLAQRGYSKDAIRRTLFRASPELLNQQPSQRQSYVRRLVDRIQGKVQQIKKVEAQKKLEKPDKQVTNPIAIMRDSSVSSNPKMWKFLAEKAAAALLIKNTAKEATKQIAKESTETAAKKAAEETAKKSAEQAVKNNAARKISEKEMRELTDRTTKSAVKDKGTKVETAPKKISDKSPEAKPSKDTGKENNPYPKNTREHREFDELMTERASRIDKIFERGKNLEDEIPGESKNAQHYRQKISQVKKEIDSGYTKQGKEPISKKEFNNVFDKKMDLEIAKSMRQDGRNAEGIKKAIEEASPEAGMLPKDMREPYAADIAKKAEEWWGQVQNQRPERSNFKIDIPPTSPDFTPDIER